MQRFQRAGDKLTTWLGYNTPPPDDDEQIPTDTSENSIVRDNQSPEEKLECDIVGIVVDDGTKTGFVFHTYTAERIKKICSFVAVHPQR